jgi:hypothetical protein
VCECVCCVCVCGGAVRQKESVCLFVRVCWGGEGDDVCIFVAGDEFP